MYDQKTDYKSLLQFQEDKNTIHIIIDNTIVDSPILENDKIIKIWQEDCKSPLFIKMLMERIESIQCP